MEMNKAQLWFFSLSRNSWTNLWRSSPTDCAALWQILYHVCADMEDQHYKSC